MVKAQRRISLFMKITSFALSVDKWQISCKLSEIILPNVLLCRFVTVMSDPDLDHGDLPGCSGTRASSKRKAVSLSAL